MGRVAACTEDVSWDSFRFLGITGTYQLSVYAQNHQCDLRVTLARVRECMKDKLQEAPPTCCILPVKKRAARAQP